MAKRQQTLGDRRRRVGAAKAAVVRPVYPLLALMFAGVWLAWPWFLLNEHLMKSDDLRRQAKVVALGLVGAAGIAAIVLALVEAEVLGVREARYAYVLLVAWKVGISYVLERRQGKSFSLWEYFGGQALNGLPIVLVARYLSGLIFEHLPFGLLWLVLR